MIQLRMVVDDNVQQNEDVSPCYVRVLGVRRGRGEHAKDRTQSQTKSKVSCK